MLGTWSVLGFPSVAGAHDPAASKIVQRVTLDGQRMTLRLYKAPLRGPHFEVLVQQAGGGYERFTPPRERAFLGTVDERPGAVASRIVLPSGKLRGAIYFDRGATWFTLGEEVTSTRGTDAQAFAWPSKPNLAAGRSGAGMRAWDAAVDVASDFHADYEGSVEQVLDEVEFGLSAVRAIYMRDALLKPRLARVIVRSDPEADPYVGDAALGALRDEWRANQTDAERDEALLLEGSQSEIGGGVAYGTDFNPDFAYAAQGSEDGTEFSIFARHEIGHNFDVDDNHAGGPEGDTLLEGNAVARFSGPELQTVWDSRDTRKEVFDPLGRFRVVPVAPYAGLDLHDAAPGSMTAIDVLANDHDANGDTLRLVSVEAATAAGGSAEIAGDKVAYTAPAEGAGKDSFQYVVADSCGQTATGVVFTRSTDSGGAVPATGFDTTGPTGPRTRCPRARLVEVDAVGRRARVTLRAPRARVRIVVTGKRAFKPRTLALRPRQQRTVTVKLRPGRRRLTVTATTIGSTLPPATRTVRVKPR